MAFILDWSENGVVTTYSGDLDGTSILACSEAVFTDARFSKISYIMRDLSDVKNINVSAEQIRQIAHKNALAYKKNANIKFALVSEEALVKGLVNMYKVYYEMSFNDDGVRWDTELFDDIYSAKQWVGLAV